MIHNQGSPTDAYSTHLLKQLVEVQTTRMGYDRTIDPGFVPPSLLAGSCIGSQGLVSPPAPRPAAAWRVGACPC